MSKARAGKEVHAIAENKIGTLSDISQWLADKAINVKAVCAYIDGAKAHFLFVTSDNKKAMEILRAKEITATEDEIVIVEMQDKVGMLKDLAKKLKSEDIDIEYIYGSAPAGPNVPSLIVFDCNDNKKAINVING
ncbi:MAG: hypothetical protein KKD05_04205 [Candidatus Omnitrophica bacterium]|nr:hypothetical protein [Candidatus Omnitrophota bacterium]